VILGRLVSARDRRLASVSGISPIGRIEQVGPHRGANADIELSVLGALGVLKGCFLIVGWRHPSRKTLAQLLEHVAMMARREGAGKRKTGRGVGRYGKTS
jgi:hypothetical protein